MEEKNKKNLTDALAQLPQHEPAQDHWQKIEASLAFEDRLQQLLPELPQHEPEARLWHRIEEQLLPQEQPKHFRLSDYFRHFPAAAATLLLLLATIYVLKIQKSQKVKISYSEEIAKQTPEPFSATRIPSEGLQFIQEQCGRQPDVCLQPEVKELQQQLLELENEQQKLQEQIKMFGEDPVLIRSQIKLENLRATCTKELIQILIS
jgi:hypothetical protein